MIRSRIVRAVIVTGGTLLAVRYWIIPASVGMLTESLQNTKLSFEDPSRQQKLLLKALDNMIKEREAKSSSTS